MPETMPEKPKASLSPSLCIKGAAFALVLTGAVFLAVFIAATLPEKTTGWQAALPTASMSEAEAEAALLRAQYLHEAAVRPRLIRAGFFAANDVAGKRNPRGAYHNESAFSETLARALWNVRPFPELHDALLAALLDAKTDPRERVAAFSRYAGFLAATADAIAYKNSDAYRARDSYNRNWNGETAETWFEYFRYDPRVQYGDNGERRYSSRRETAKDAATAVAEFDAKLALARQVLPMVLADIQKDTAAQGAMDAEEKKQGKPKGGKASPERRLEELSATVNEAVRAMWRERANPAFLALAKDMLNSGEGTVIQRYEAIPLIAQKPGLPLAEYLFWQQYKQDLASVTACVGTSPSSYAYLLGCMDKLMTATTNEMKARGSFLLGGQTGPGVTMTRTGDFAPARNLSGSLYLLADMALAMKDAPAYDLDRACPIFRGTLYRYMENQPLVLPLNPDNPKDAAVITWYADKGWRQGRTLLFSAVGSPADVARHWASVHLLWWPSGKGKADADPDLAFLHPVSGHFMTGLVPQLKGKGVSRFLGPITGLWFGRRNVDKNGWFDEKFEARPETAPTLTAAPRTPLRSPLLDWFAKERTQGETERAEKPLPVQTAPAYAEATATIILSKEVRKATGDAYRYNYRINLARQIDAKYKDDKAAPMDVFSFVDNAVTMLGEWGLTSGRDVAPATEYLWRFRNDPALEKRVRDILSDTKQRPYERMRKVRRALGLPEKTS